MPVPPAPCAREGWRRMLGSIWLLVPCFVAPVLVARFLFRGRWIELLQAYCIWIALLLAFGFTQGSSRDEGYGWALIIALFSTVFAIPVLVLLLKLWKRLRTRSGGHP